MCQVSDTLIDRVCNLDETETNPIIERLLACISEEEFTEDEDKDILDTNKAEAVVIE